MLSRLKYQHCLYLAKSKHAFLIFTQLSSDKAAINETAKSFADFMQNFIQFFNLCQNKNLQWMELCLIIQSQIVKNKKKLAI